MQSVRVFLPGRRSREGRQGVEFAELRDAGSVELAARYDAEGADELVLLDITASSDERSTSVARRGACG